MLPANAQIVWLASDEDREGEAIAWHLFEVLGLKPENTRRIVFHEITKNAILNAIKNPRNIDLNLVDAQQARRVLDRIVGFELSPVLWKKIKPSLSAGRVQSVAVRLIVEREEEIKNFKPEPYVRVTAVFQRRQAKSSRRALSTSPRPRLCSHFPQRLRKRLFHRWRHSSAPAEKISGSPIHNVYFATRSRSQTRLHCLANHDGSSTSLRIRSYHLHAYRQFEPIYPCYRQHQQRNQ